MSKISKVNARIRQLNNTFDFHPQALQSLYDRISIIPSSITPTGYLSNRQYSEMEQKIIDKALDIFINSKTSTVKGVKSQVNRFQSYFDNPVNINDQQSDNFFYVYETAYMSTLLKYLTPSELNEIITYAQQHTLSHEDFISEVMQTVGEHDVDFINALGELYEDIYGLH